MTGPHNIERRVESVGHGFSLAQTLATRLEKDGGDRNETISFYIRDWLDDELYGRVDLKPDGVIESWAGFPRMKAAA